MDGVDPGVIDMFDSPEQERLFERERDEFLVRYRCELIDGFGVDAVIDEVIDEVTPERHR